jgi:hypothetical protein
VTPRDLTESLQHARYTVLTTNHATARLVVRTAAGTLYDLECRTGIVVVGSRARSTGIGTLAPGDIIAIQAPGEVSLLRRAWEESGSPEH